MSSASSAAVNSVDAAPMDTIESGTENLSISGRPPMGLTENLSPTFLATGNPCLDFFFHVVPDTPPKDLISRLELAWSFDPLTTLKLICNLRGVRGTGKSDKEGFYGSALWLFQHHPKTLTLNLKAIAEFGYFKDLPEILYRILEGADCRKIAKEIYQSRKRKGRRGTGRRRFEEIVPIDFSEDERPAAVVVDKETARILRKEREAAKMKKAMEKYRCDLNYRNLHDAVADLFAELLRLDVSYLSSGDLNKISLAAKWCPSIDSSYDKAILICRNVAKRVFPKESDEAFKGMEEEEYLLRVRDRLRKKVLVPLRKALELPEVYMSANEWSNLKYNRVASVAMKNYKKLFVKHDSERFAEYLEDVKSGKAKIAAGALLPHQIIKCLEDEDGGEVAELQWSRMVEDMKKKGKLDNCIAVCDVSGSMSGIPMEVSVALGLLLSELSEEPWKGNVITFSADPQLHIIEGDTLKDKTDFIRSMDWGMNTDLRKVFDRLLEVAVNGKLSVKQMVKRVFIFSDMEFDEATKRFQTHDWEKTPSDEGNEDDEAVDYEEIERKNKERQRLSWKTDYEVIQTKFQEHGYSKVPEIVFWNLRDSSATPVPADQPGVALLSGFSKNLLTLFLEGGGIVSPVEVMHAAIGADEYQKLMICD
uniref:Uncharacterized protein n=1 Tax=Kalanchoe fedtschenkoi TaxID=63787 RepID=A0A7N0UU27_KALFE